MVAEIPDCRIVRTYVCSESFSRKSDLSNFLRFSNLPVLVVSDSRFTSLADTVTPQGVLAVCEKRKFTLEQLYSPGDKDPFLLIGECLSDPGNIGTLIRTAAAAGASGVVLSAGSGDVWNPKTIRASAGAVLHIPIIEGVCLTDIIPILKQSKITILAAHLEGETLPYSLNLRSACGILIGNEALGLSAEVAALADVKVKLPVYDGVESLNASVAGGILLYEVVRQRALHTANNIIIP